MANFNSNLSFSWDFSQGVQTWQAGFADYPKGEDSFYELNSGYASVPFNLGTSKALFITGHNRSDDLFMYWRKNITGLAPNTTYKIKFDLNLATSAATGIGIGGDPAQSVYLKAGATLVEPLPVLEPSSNFLALNIDKGFQSQVGKDSVLLGNIQKPNNDTSDYELINRQSDQEQVFKSDATGSAWLYFGTDSGYEGLTSLYYTKFQAQFTSVPEPLTVMGLISALIGSIILKRFKYRSN